MYKATVLQADRPRDVNAFQAAAILYGDWGTSKAYVIGLAFALAAYSSIWLIIGISILSILVGLNYTLICKYYPNGGGVYASVRHRSEVLALIGGFFLIGDYIITASLSSVSAFSYIGVVAPEFWAICSIGFIGALNFFGPRHTGNLAFLITIFAVLVIITLAFFSLFFLDQAIHNVKPLSHDWSVNWVDFVGVVVALSGIEAIANMTGVMKLDPGSDPAHPSVVRTSTPAIITVMLEVCFFTTLFSLAANALPGLTFNGDQISAPGYPNVRDSMLRYMGEVFGTILVSPDFGVLFGVIISLAFAILLLSAVNTAIVALSSLLYVMSRDGQFPALFQKINKFGVPIYPLIISIVAPMLVLLYAHDMEKLASLYAIGFVGAIATNLGSTSTDPKLSLKMRERIFMFGTFLIMFAIEVTLFYEKDHARTFMISVIIAGLILKSLVQEQKHAHHPYRPPGEPVLVDGVAKKALAPIVMGENGKLHEEILDPQGFHSIKDEVKASAENAILCAVTHVGKSLHFGINECKKTEKHLYILFIREHRVVVQSEFYGQNWKDDPQATEVFHYAMQNLKEDSFTFLYDLSDAPALNIISHAKKFKVSCVIVGMSRKNRLLQFIRGDVISEVYRKLPAQIDLIIIS